MKQHRDTRQRSLILETVRSRCDHPSADQVYMSVRMVDDRISRGTVYRNLSFLVRNGSLAQIKVPGADRFDFRLDRHHHMICTGCGAVCDVKVPYILEVDQNVAEETGYIVRGHQTLFEGLCPDCQKKLEDKPQNG